MNEENTFLGRGWGFPPEFSNRSKSVTMVEAEDDILESLRILLATVPKERVMHPSYGCALKLQVFENINESVLTIIKDSIERAVLFFEPRIDLKEIAVDDTQAYEGILLLTLHYTVRTTNNRGNLVYPFYFKEGTNVG